MILLKKAKRNLDILSVILMKKNNYAHNFKEKTSSDILWKKKNWKEIEKLIFTESLIFFFLISQKFDTPNVSFYLPTEKTFFIETYTIQYKADQVC